MSATLNTCLIIALIFFSCLYYGSTTLLGAVIIESVVAVLVLWWLVDLARQRQLSFMRTGIFFFFASFVGLCLFQLIPLPLPLIRLIGGHGANLYRQILPNNTLTTFKTLSICPNATVGDLMKFISYIGAFFLVVNRLELKRHFGWIINAIIFLGVIISVFGIVQKYSYKERVYWFDLPVAGIAPFGPFINRNNFSGYINMIIPLALGAFLSDASLSKKAIYGISAWIMVLALFLSSSRAGLLIFISVLLCMIVLSRMKESLKKRTRLLLVSFSLIFLFSFFHIDFKELWTRVTHIFTNEMLVVFGHGYSWRDILRICRDFPLFGTGLGTFGNISTMYKTTSVQVIFTYAHNDYFQLLSETGLAGFFCVSAAFILYSKKLIAAWLERRNIYAVAMVAGGICSIFGMLVYSLLDFNLHIPATALLFFVIMGLIFRMTWAKMEYSRPEYPSFIILAECS